MCDLDSLEREAERIAGALEAISETLKEIHMQMGSCHKVDAHVTGGVSAGDIKEGVAPITQVLWGIYEDLVNR